MALILSSYPIDGPLRITSHFGQRSTNIKGASTNHKGIDIGRDFTKKDTAVLAVKSGIVRFVGWGDYRGWYIILGHTGYYSTVYQHLKEKPALEVGDRVRAGQKIGIMGNSSNPAALKCAVHLHFEVREGATCVDPEEFLNNLEKEVTGMTESEITALVKSIIKEVLAGNNTDVSAWAKEDVERAIAEGITDGTRPGGYVTREQAAVMIMRAKK